jgi:cytochrome P450
MSTAFSAAAQIAPPEIRRAPNSPYPAGPSLLHRLRTGSLFRQNAADFLVANARQYGDLVHFRANGRHIFQFNHPELVSEMLVRDVARHHRGLVMQRARFVLGDGLLTSEEPLHMRQRRLTQPAFHRQRVAAYGDIIGHIAARTSSGWPRGATVDLHHEMLLLALRIVGKTLFSAEVESEVRRVSTAVDAFMSFLPLAFLPYPNLLLRLPMPRMKRIRHGQAQLDDLIYGLIRQRRQDPGDRGDLLSMLLESVDEDDPANPLRDREELGESSAASSPDAGPSTSSARAGMSDRQVRDECLTLLLAGHETTANALSFALWLLATHPETQDQLHAEAASVLNSRPAIGADYPRLPLANAVFAEAMRVYPPVWVTARTAAESYEYRGFPIPEGSLLLAPQIAIHRDPRFWPNPDEFLPARFLPSRSPSEPSVAAASSPTDAERSARPRLAYFPFGAGSRQCIGEGLAWMEGVLVLATIVRDWRLTPPPDAAPKLALTPRITLRPQNGLPLRLERR